MAIASCYDAAMAEDLHKVIARLRTATLPKLADVYLVCDELERLLTPQPANTVSTEPANTISTPANTSANNRNAYMRAYMAKRRAKAKAASQSA
jgi:hypothetical protein